MKFNDRELLLLVLAGGAVLILAEPEIERGIKQVVAGFREKDFLGMVDAVAVNYGIDPNILRAIVMQESTWNPEAVSADGQDIGLAQIRLSTARAFRPELRSLSDADLKTWLKNPQNNIDLAGRVLSELTRHGLGSVPEVFHAYNVGETKFRQGIRSPYAERYLAHYHDYSGGENAKV